jgi:hypothetical protein
MDKHDFSYVLFSAALGALGVFLIAGLALEDRVLLIFSGLCLGLALIASIVYMIHLARGPRYKPRLNENGDIISIWCLRCMKATIPNVATARAAIVLSNNGIRLSASMKTPEEVAALGAIAYAERRFLKGRWLF